MIKFFPASPKKHDPLAVAYDSFLQAYPTYKNTAVLDQLRKTEYGRLDAQQQIYLDYTGGGLYSDSQLQQHLKILQSNVLGNPHSANPTSLAMTELVEETRAYVLQYFNADPKEYFAVFTPNATGALKLVGEAYPFSADGCYALTFDNHNSVNGIREFAQNKGADIQYIPLRRPDLRIDQQALSKVLRSGNPDQNNLFALPAQSNFTGVKHSLKIINEAQRLGWDVCLDAAAFVPTNQLDLSVIKPEFVSMSFYKMFGYPTGLGALLIHKSVFSKLQRPWFAGGTVNFASVQGEGHYLTPNEAGFEDGTVNYLNIPAIKIGLEHLKNIGIEKINQRVDCLTGWLLEELLNLKHSNGRFMVRLYGPANTEMRGGTITINFYDPNGRLLDYQRIEQLANEKGISLRTGCFCNPGAGELAESLTREDMVAGMAGGASMNLPKFVKLIGQRANKSAGAIRISVGIASNFSDVYQFLQLAKNLKDQDRLNLGEVTFDIAACRASRPVKETFS
ncbi:MAG: aminotransferase class V-fold PLP-dependent enzyme [Chloroflexota bacterium]